jgi:hypothetical protein
MTRPNEPVSGTSLERFAKRLLRSLLLASFDPGALDHEYEDEDAPAKPRGSGPLKVSFSQVRAIRANRNYSRKSNNPVDLIPLTDLAFVPHLRSAALMSLRP